MKLSEMLAELEKDHTKKFKGTIKDNNDIICSFYVGCVDFRYDREYSSRSDSFRIGEYREWNEIQTPITFLEALKTSKKLRCEHILVFDMCVSTKYYDLQTLIRVLLANFTTNQFRKILSEGRFYLEG